MGRICAPQVQNAITDGWCVWVYRKDNKPGDWGYIQISANGSNHFALLQEVVLLADGHSSLERDICLHLCHHSNCANSTNIITEPAVDNECRKHCWVHVPCGHCPKQILICPHSPPCIKFVPGFDNQNVRALLFSVYEATQRGHLTSRSTVPIR